MYLGSDLTSTRLDTCDGSEGVNVGATEQIKENMKHTSCSLRKKLGKSET